MADIVEITGASLPILNPTSSFTQKLIDVQVILNPNNPIGTTGFAGGSTIPLLTGPINTPFGNSVILSGHRTTVRITNVSPIASYAHVQIFGMLKQTMDQLSSLGQLVNQVQGNTIIISAGDAVTGMTPVFRGTPFYSYPEYDTQPEVPFVFAPCIGGLAESVISAAPSSFPGVTDLATMMKGWAKQMGLQFENNLQRQVMMANPYYAGNLWPRAQQAARDGGAQVAIVPDNGGMLTLLPQGGSRTSLTTVPVISPQTGMIGYPSFAVGGYLIVKFLYNPQVKFLGNIQIESSIPQAMGKWTVYRLDLHLDSLVKNGQWMETATCFKAGLPAPPPPGALTP